jgi:hypothetical protein
MYIGCNVSCCPFPIVGAKPGTILSSRDGMTVLLFGKT